MTPRALDLTNAALACALLAVVLGAPAPGRKPPGVAIKAVGRIGGGAPEIAMLSLKTVCVTSFLKVEGTLLNVSPAPLTGVVLAAIFRDGSGKETARSVQVLLPCPIVPGRRVDFTVPTPDENEVRHVDVEFRLLSGPLLGIVEAPGSAIAGR